MGKYAAAVLETVVRGRCSVESTHRKLNGCLGALSTANCGLWTLLDEDEL